MKSPRDPSANTTHHLSKSRFVAGLQCHKQLWWRVHEPDAPELEPDAGLQANFDRGHRVGELARTHVPGGVLIDLPPWKFRERVAATQKALSEGAKVVYEASFISDRVFAAVDILERRRGGFGIIEVKSTVGLKDAHLSTKLARYHTAGSLDGGRRVWALIKADGVIRVGPDEVEKFLLLTTSHDGSLCFTAGFTPVRCVCSNTIAAALAGMRSKVAIRHSGQLQSRVAEAQRTLGIADSYFSKFVEMGEAMVRAPYGDRQLNDLVSDMFPADSEKGIVGPRIQQHRDNVIRLFSEGMGHGPIRGTAWAAYNAVAEFTDHTAKSRRTDRMSAEESRFNSALLGSGAVLKQRAVTKIAEQIGLRLVA